jgi:hypothetical protein
MVKNHGLSEYNREITPIERFLARSPFSIVTMVARIRGSVTGDMVRNAVLKMRLRHPILRSRIIDEDGGRSWFTSQGVGEILVELVPRESGDHWAQVAHESSQVPFEFETRPAIRFILLQSPNRSDLVILCHHVICDGLSLAYLARDLMQHLGDPARDVEMLPDPVPITRDNIPGDVSANAIVKYLIGRMNRKWAGERVLFDQEDYRELTQAYWRNYTHQIMTAELSGDETAALMERCRREGVTVNSALSAAFVGAQYAVQVQQPFHASIAVAGSLRDRVQPAAGEVMGFYAGVVRPKFKYNGRQRFWENARQFHRKVRPLLTNKNLFEDLLVWTYLDPSLLEAINFKKLGRFVPEDAQRYQKLSSFGARDDVVLSMLKREKMASLDRIIMGTAITNLTRMDFPVQYGALGLERLIMNPGGAFPLANVNLVLGAVTCSGRLSLLLEFVEDNVDCASMAEIKDTALGFLFDGK